jgi:His-Xaa-Ser system protein HxsD
MQWNVTISLDSSVYTLSVVQRVSYKLAPTLTISAEQTNSVITLHIAPTLMVGPGMQLTPENCRELVQRHLNDFALRELIQRETSGLREIIASAALRGAGI